MLCCILTADIVRSSLAIHRQLAVLLKQNELSARTVTLKYNIIVEKHLADSEASNYNYGIFMESL